MARLLGLSGDEKMWWAGNQRPSSTRHRVTLRRSEHRVPKTQDAEPERPRIKPRRVSDHTPVIGDEQPGGNEGRCLHGVHLSAHSERGSRSDRVVLDWGFADVCNSCATIKRHFYDSFDCGSKEHTVVVRAVCGVSASNLLRARTYITIILQVDVVLVTLASGANATRSAVTRHSHPLTNSRGLNPRKSTKQERIAMHRGTISRSS